MDSIRASEALDSGSIPDEATDRKGKLLIKQFALFLYLDRLISPSLNWFTCPVYLSDRQAGRQACN
jgi:hypothetical protein